MPQPKIHLNICMAGYNATAIHGSIQRTMLLRTKAILVGIVWAGAVLRFNGLFFSSYTSDETLFAYWARLIAVWRDPLLANELVDKPPLLFYIQASLFPLFGAVDWVARIPDLAASLMIIALTGMIAWQLFKDKMIAIFAAALIALSPLAIRYSSSAYTDPLLSFFLLSSISVVLKGQPSENKHTVLGKNSFTAGLLFGLAAATKYQAWLFFPLIVGFGSYNRWSMRTWLKGAVGTITIALVVVVWEVARTGGFTLISRQLASFGGLRFTWSWELWPRLEAWGGIWASIFSSPILHFALLLGLPLFLGMLIYQMSRPTSYVHLLLAFTLGFLVFHWFLAIPTWDRYLVPLIPIIAVLISALIFQGINYVLDNFLILPNEQIKVAKFVLLIPFALVLVQLMVAISSYQESSQGATQSKQNQDMLEVADYLMDAPYGTVLYDHWYSWQWRYFLFDSKVYLSWFPGPNALVEDLQVFRLRQNLNYIVLPEGPEALPVIRGLRDAGFNLSVVDSETFEQPPSTMQFYKIDAVPVLSS